jgi:hypothetical protein
MRSLFSKECILSCWLYLANRFHPTFPSISKCIDTFGGARSDLLSVSILAAYLQNSSLIRSSSRTSIACARDSLALVLVFPWPLAAGNSGQVARNQMPSFSSNGECGGMSSIVPWVFRHLWRMRRLRLAAQDEVPKDAWLLSP